MAELHFNINWWEEWIRRDFIAQIEIQRDGFLKRILPTFDNLEDEADQIGEEAYTNIGTDWPPDSDPADAAELAYDEATRYFQSMVAFRQTMLNLSIVSLYQLFEQQCIYMVRKDYLDDCPDIRVSDFKLCNFIKIIDWCGLGIKAFKSWPKLQEMHDLCNAIKHADGPSAQKLRDRRPELLHHEQKMPTNNSPWGGRTRLYQPLAGEELYVSPEDVTYYANVLTQFWEEFISQSKNLND